MSWAVWPSSRDPLQPDNGPTCSPDSRRSQVRSICAQHLILRTSWVVSAHGANFVKSMLRLGATRDSLNVVADQIGGPTPAADIADALYAMAAGLLAGKPGGVLHFAGAPDCSWADFAVLP